MWQAGLATATSLYCQVKLGCLNIYLVLPCYVSLGKSRRYLLWSQNTPNPPELSDHSLTFSWRGMRGFWPSARSYLGRWGPASSFYSCFLSFLLIPLHFFLILQQPYWDAVIAPGDFPLQICSSVAFNAVMKSCDSLQNSFCYIFIYLKRNHDKV